MNRTDEHSRVLGERAHVELSSGSAVPSADLADRCQATLDDLDKTGLGIGVEPGYLAALREDLTCYLARLASRRSGDLGDLRRFEGLVARSMGFVDDWTAAFLQMMLRRHLHDMGLSTTRRVRGAHPAEQARDCAALEGAIAVCRRKRRVAGPGRRG